MATETDEKQTEVASSEQPAARKRKPFFYDLAELPSLSNASAPMENEMARHFAKAGGVVKQILNISTLRVGYYKVRARAARAVSPSRRQSAYVRFEGVVVLREESNQRRDGVFHSRTGLCLGCRTGGRRNSSRFTIAAVLSKPFSATRWRSGRHSFSIGIRMVTRNRSLKLSVPSPTVVGAGEGD